MFLDSYSGVINGGFSGSEVLPGDPEGSRIIRRLRGIDSSARMPFGGPFLSDDQIGVIAAWIAAGAKDN